MPDIRLLNLTIWLSGEGTRPIYFEGKNKNFKAFLCPCNKRQQIYSILLLFLIFLISSHFCTIADFCCFFCMSCLMSVWMCALYYVLMFSELYFFAHPRMRTFWRSCSGYRLGADRTYRHFQLWQSVKRPPSRVCSVSLTKFDFSRPALQFSVLRSL